MQRLTHISDDGRAQMVDVSAKPMSMRRAVAGGKIRLQRKTLDLISKDQIAKGNVFATARIAGIQAAKQTAHLIPLCHAVDKEMQIYDVRLIEKTKHPVAAAYDRRSEKSRRS